MATLLDIANVPRFIEIQGQKVEVFGLSGETIAALMVRFPDIGKALSGQREVKITRETLMKAAPELLGIVLAAGTGHLGDPAHEAAARKLGAQDQLDLLDEILRLTFPRGLGPLLQKLTEFAAAVGGEEVAGLSRMLTQGLSKPSSTKDTTTHGDTPPSKPAVG